MKKLISSLIIIFSLCTLSASANPDKVIQKAIKRAELSKTALISISFKEVISNKQVIDYNSTVPMSVASVQKLVTTIPAFEKLDKNYEFKTSLYKGKDKSLYIKLGADPYLTSRTLRDMLKAVKESSLNHIYIDDSIVDRIEWGEGWQWDNTLNTYMPKFGAYNMDSNLISVVVRPTTMGSPADIFTMKFYPLNIENNTISGTSTNIKFSSRDYMQPDFIEISGSVGSKFEKQIPINDLRKYFILQLKDSLRKNKIAYYGKFERKAVPNNAVLIVENKNSIEKVLKDILQNSNNMMSETLFKIAGGGTEEKAIEMFKQYYDKQNINISGVKITDASGVSKNNLLNADFITEVLVNDYTKTRSIKRYMATPGVGTLANRMLYFKDNLIAKTGTLQNVSAIAGYITSENDKIYAFCIIVNDANSKDADKKAFEEYILRTAYEAL